MRTEDKGDIRPLLDAVFSAGCGCSPAFAAFLIRLNHLTHGTGHDVPAGATRIDLSDCVCMPGLMDMHVHN
mgnify:CR=1 FL=1